MSGFVAILLKELAHIRRDRGTIFFAFLVPALQLTIFGYAIDVTIQDIPLVVFDLDGRQESRRFVESLENTGTFVIAERVVDTESFHRSITAGRSKVGVLIPADFSNRLLRREQASVQVLIDGSDSQVATTALNAVNLLAINLSIGRAKVVAEQFQRMPARDASGRASLPIDARARLLFNPDLESSHFFVPGLIGIILQLVLVFMTSFSIVRERETGTLEQLFVTPVGPAGLLLGKLTPYACMAFAELCGVLLLMIGVFHVGISGNILLLLAMSCLFIVNALGLGLLISTIARTQLGAMQMAFISMLPSVLLSGFMFPRSEMPAPIYLATFAIPATYFIEILRAVILRGADLIDIFPQFIGLVCCGAVIIIVSFTRFHKKLD